jgi:dipeptidyl aminopeptidase/acylaminoacyl peptidase
MRFCLALWLTLILQSAPPPDTEIFLASLTVRNGQVTIGTPVNISNNPGYDNQPSFTPDGEALLFTSVRGGRKPDPTNSAASGSDIYRYDVAPGRVTQLTNTPESEYSPTVMPDGAHFSTVRVEADGTQRLWRFSMNGSDPALVLADIKPVGYHVWVDARTLVLYVLGQPATLLLADATTGKAGAVASGVGRSIQRAPDGTVSFVQRRQAGASPATNPAALTTMLVAAPAGATEVDTAWTPEGMLLVAQGATLFGWRRGDPAFTSVADLSALGLRGVTRLSVSPRGDRIALVAQPR